MIRYSSPSSLISLPEYLPNRTRSAGFEIEGYQFPVIETPALADCDYFALLRLFLRRIGNDNTAPGRLSLLDPLDHGTVVQRSDFHHVFTSD